MDLNDRKIAVLSLIAKGYLNTGEPVGSKSLVAQLGGTVSSATIRNDMADLERQGLVFQPHTSAGRIPTSLGLTLYIDKLMEKQKLSKQRREIIDSVFSGVFSVEGAISAASNALADYSRCASFSTAPGINDVILKQIDFIRSGEDSLIFVLLTQTNQVKSFLVRLYGQITSEALDALSNLANKRLLGLKLRDITPAFIQTLAAELTDYSLLFSPFFSALSRAVDSFSEPEVSVKGQDNLFRSELEKSKALRALDFLKSQSLFDLISPGVKIIIPDADGTALIYSGYHFSQDRVGALGVLGPSRLDYSTLIPMLEYFSASLENMIKNNKLEE